MAKADIYYDELGRRRVDRGQDKPDAENPLQAMEARIAALEAKLIQAVAENQVLKGRLDRFRLVAQGSVQISGQGDQGITIGVPDANGAGGAIGGQFNNFEMCDGSVWALYSYQVS